MTDTLFWTCESQSPSNRMSSDCRSLIYRILPLWTINQGKEKEVRKVEFKLDATEEFTESFTKYDNGKHELSLRKKSDEFALLA